MKECAARAVSAIELERLRERRVLVRMLLSNGLRSESMSAIAVRQVHQLAQAAPGMQAGEDARLGARPGEGPDAGAVALGLVA